jgi:hypothetical protein
MVLIIPARAGTGVAASKSVLAVEASHHPGGLLPNRRFGLPEAVATLGGMTTRRRWTPETIQAELAPIVAELGRMPKREELAERGLSGLTSAMQRHGGAAAWKERMLAPVAATSAVAETPAVAHEHIAVAAYFKSLEHEADPVAIWLDAERELVGTYAS